MKDRVPTKPNRYAVYDDNHNFLRYEYHERADEPTEEGDPINKGNLFPDEVAAILGLDPADNPQVKDGFVALAIGNGNRGYAITVTYPNGAPAAGIELTGITKPGGGPAITNKNGFVLGVSESDTVTVEFNSPFIDIKDFSQTYTASGTITFIDIQLEEVDGGYAVFKTSGYFKFSPAVAKFDACLVGGGGGGHFMKPDDYGGYDYGGGGGGGYVENYFDLSATSDSDYTVIVGAGGTGGIYSSTTYPTHGGFSSLSGPGVPANTRALGGTRGYAGSGGAGNGKGGNGGYNGGTGGAGTVYEFDDPSRPLFGGGGGGGGSVNGGAGGAPYGGRGGGDYSYGRATAGTGPGGGGGGGGYYYPNGSDGYRGQVSIRWRYTE